MRLQLWLLFAVSALAPASNWPQWRGPEWSGVSSESNLPLEWSPTKNVAWKTVIPGRGHSSPVVWGNLVFLTAALEGAVIEGRRAPVHKIDGEAWVHPDSSGANRSHTLKVLCLDASTGKILWERTAYEGPVFDDRHKKNTYASSTPVTDGKFVYAWFGGEGLYAYDFSGKLVWKYPVGAIANMGMGPGTSLAAYKNLLIMQCDREFDGVGSELLAVEKGAGKLAWKTARTDPASWATPILIQTPVGPGLIVSSSKNVITYDPATGKEMWRAKGTAGHAIPNAVTGLGMVFVSAGYPSKRAMGLTLDGTLVWEYEKGTAYVPSPILYGEYLYLMTDKGLVTCVDAKTGKVKYEGARVLVPATFTASPVALDGKILLTSEDGDTFVIKAGPVHEVLRTNSVGEPVYASPAISNGRIFLRGQKTLFCIRKGA